jgi:hypothetical protein
VATFGDADPGGAAGDYTATVQWGDGTSSTLTASGGGIVANPGGGFSVVGGHAYAEEGSYNLSVQVSDAGGASITGTGSAVVADAPLAAAAQDVAGTEGTALGNAVVAQLTDTDPTDTTSDPAKDTSDYSATISWTDANGPHSVTGAVVFTGPGRTFQVQLTGNTVLEDGSYNLAVTIQDVGGASVTVTSVATIADAPLSGSGVTLHAIEGQGTGSAVLAHFTDSNTSTNPQTDAASFSATISYTDSSGIQHSGAGAIVYSGSDHTFNVLASGGFTFSEEGNYTVNVLVQDRGGASVPIASHVLVADAPVIITGTPPSFSGTEGGTMSNALVASFADTDVTNTEADPPGDVADYRAVVTWDDGLGQSHTSAGRVVATGGDSFAVYADDTVPMLQGQHSITVTVSDVGGATVSSADLLTVGPGPDAPSATGSSLSVTEGQAFSAVLGGYVNLDQPSRAAGGNTVQIDWGDGTSSAGSVVLVSPGHFNVTGTHTYQEEGNYTATFAVTAAGSTSSVQASTGVHVTDAPLTMLAMTPPSVVLTGQPLNAYPLATFSDTDPFHALGDFSAQISWGDGAVTAGAIQDNGNGTYSVLGSHVYGPVGTMTLTVTVHDAGGASASGSARVPAVGGGVSTPLFLGDMQVPAPAPLSPFALEMELFQAFETWFFQELQLFFALLSGV